MGVEKGYEHDLAPGLRQRYPLAAIVARGALGAAAFVFASAFLLKMCGAIAQSSRRSGNHSEQGVEDTEAKCNRDRLWRCCARGIGFDRPCPRDPSGHDPSAWRNPQDR